MSRHVRAPLMMLLLAFAVPAFLPATAQADDSVAVLGAGGVTLAKSDSVALVDQSLYLSPVAVRVRFVFRNTSRQPVESPVAFVLPDLDYSAWAKRENFMQGSDDPRNFLDFKVRVNGKAVAPKPVIRAVLKGRDVTDAVPAAGFPVSFVGPKFRAAYNALPALKRAALVKQRLIAEEQPARPDEPAWVVRTRFVWSQTFPAGRDVIVEHDYHPALGTLPILDAESAATYCHGPAPAGMRPWVLHYSLTTGGNWAGGRIGTLHLRVETDSPAQTIATCFPGLARDGPHSYAATYRDFRPEQDIRLLFLNHKDDSAMSADCAGVRAKPTAYQDCLAFIAEILAINVKQSLQEARATYAAMDDKDRKAGRGHANHVQILDQAQRAWRIYLKAECAAVSARAAPGTDATTAAMRCRNTLMRQRLRAFYNGY